jgi:hypothetical protein
VQYTAPSGTNSFDGSPKIYVAENDPASQEARRVLFDMVKFRTTGVDLYQPGLMFSNPENLSYYLMTEAETLTWRSFLGTLLTSYAYQTTTISDVLGTNPTGGRYAMTVLQFSGDPTAFVVKYFEDMQLIDEVAGIGYVYNKINLLRLEEVLLARAEANAMLGNFQEALDDLNIYLQRKIDGYGNSHRLDKDKVINYYGGKIASSFVDNEFNINAFNQSGNARRLQQALIMSVMDLRRAEFFLEGMRYFDILRWNIPVTHTRLNDNMSRTLYPDDDNRILQLPATTVLSGLPLNPMSKIRDPWPGVAY